MRHAPKNTEITFDGVTGTVATRTVDGYVRVRFHDGVFAVVPVALLEPAPAR